MKLQEILKSLELSEDNIKAINGAVDAVITSKVASKDEEIKTLNGSLETMKGELTPFKEAKRKSHLQTLVGDLTSEEKLNDAIALSGITDEDDDEAIKAKVSKTIEGRAYLQKDAGTPEELKETKNKPATSAVKEDKYKGL